MNPVIRTETKKGTLGRMSTLSLASLWLKKDDRSEKNGTSGNLVKTVKGLATSKIS